MTDKSKFIARKLDGKNTEPGFGQAWENVLKNPSLQNDIERLTGIPWKTLYEQSVSHYRSEGEQLGHTGAALATSAAKAVLHPKHELEGAGKLSTIIVRPVANALQAVVQAIGRVITAVLPHQIGLTRGAERIVRTGHTVAEEVSGTVAKRTIIRPDDVSFWRETFTQPVVGKEVKSDSEFTVNLDQAGNKFEEKVKAANKTCNKQISKSGQSETQQVTVLDVLKEMFGDETKALDQQLNARGIFDSTERNAYMLGALQKVCYDEMQAYEWGNQNADLITTLTGREMKMPHTAIDTEKDTRVSLAETESLAYGR